MSKLRHLCLSLFLFFPVSLFGFEGFYVGGSTGPGLTFGKQEGSVDVAASVGFLVNTHQDLDAHYFHGKWEGTLFTGYGWRCHCWYAGLEAFLRYSRSDFALNRDDDIFFPGSEFPAFITHSKTKIKIGPWHYGLDTRLGYLFNPSTLLYGRIGVEGTRFDFQNESSFSLNDIFVSAKDSKKRHSAYLRLGAGLEKQLFCHLAARVDYLYTDYRRQSVHAAAASDATASVNLAAKGHLKDHSLSFGLSYYFCDHSLCENLASKFTGFYLAFAIGGSLMDGQLKGEPFGVVTSPNLVSPIVEPVNVGSHLQDTNFTGTLYAGYGYLWCRFFASVEPFFKVAPAFDKRQDTTLYEFSFSDVTIDSLIQTKARINPCQFGVDFRPGLVLTPTTLLYGKVGISYARFKIESNARAAFTHVTTAGDSIFLSLPISKRRHVATLRVGAGLELAFCPCWHLRTEYLYTDYGSHRLNDFVTQSVDDGIGSFTNKVRFHLRCHEITLGISRYF